ncbi:hypothetical protein KC333_g5107 [Hortaea werneckii]|nr:hypothetical protein KC333_g5107 [Hortaea werneckii]KAI7313795.1 hypothetical protein KC326_g5368 [Hortaea werneckii]
MGPTHIANNSRNPPALLRAFPSPASTVASSDSSSLNSPLVGNLSISSQSKATWPTRSPFHELADPVATLPDDIRAEPILTPPATDCPHVNMDLVVGGTLSPVHAAQSEQAQQKAGPRMRLPSFEALGIAAPHPDRVCQQDLDGTLYGTPQEHMKEPPGQVSEDADLTDLFARLGGGKLNSSGAPPQKIGGRATNTPVQHYVATLTPPADAGTVSWGSVPTISSAPIDFPTTDQDGSSAVLASPQSGSGASDMGNLSRDLAQSAIDDEEESWIEGAIQSLFENLRSAPIPSNPLRVLSHALPSPSHTGHVFPTIIGALHNSTPTSPTVWVNVFHAIPGRFNLADLPTSPPNTPGPAVGGDDYFTQKVFDSAVPISDYQDDLSSLPRSPRPIVPPSSINLAVVERYIPPTNANEFSDMFNTNGPSILVDRLVELSPSNGSLVFIYPTRTGAQTFVQEHLGPILDPLLRWICVVHGLSLDLSRSLGHMIAVDRMLEHDQLEHRIARLCALLTQRSTSIQRFHGSKATFSLTYSGTKEVLLTRDVWAKDWWTKQEKPRIRDIMTRYAQEAQRKSSNGHVDRPATPTELVQQLLDGVVKREYPIGQEPERGVEVGIFVIKRS